MTSRTTRKTVTFRHPFVLSGVDGTQPPGVYDVDTDEESLESLSILGYRRVATFIQVHRDGTTQVFQNRSRGIGGGFDAGQRPVEGR